MGVEALQIKAVADHEGALFPAAFGVDAEAAHAFRVGADRTGVARAPPLDATMPGAKPVSHVPPLSAVDDHRHARCASREKADEIADDVVCGNQPDRGR